MIRTPPELTRYGDCYRLERAFADTDAKLEKLIASLWRYLRVEKSGKKLIPAFDPEVQTVASDIDAVNTTLDTIEADTADFAKIMGEYFSISDMKSDVAASQKAISTADDAVKAAASNAIKSGIPIDKIAESDAVRQAEAHRDETITELSSKVDDLTDRIAKANEILERYK